LYNILRRQPLVRMWGVVWPSTMSSSSSAERRYTTRTCSTK